MGNMKEEINVENEEELNIENQEGNIYPMSGIKVDKGFYSVFELKRRYDAEDKRIILEIAGIIDNIYTYIHFLKWMIKQESANIKYIFEHYKFSRQIVFCTFNGRCYAEEAIENNNLTVKDKLKILENIPNLINSLEKGEKTPFWDALANDIYEYRLSVSQGREFRLFFFQNERIYFLNGFIKKTQETPKREIDRAKKLKKEAEQNF